MQRYIVLLRGINVGGRHKLPMQSLRDILRSLGAHDVRSYIQSGNAVIWSPALDETQFGSDVAAAIASEHGFLPAVMVLPLARFDAIRAANPFPAAEAAPKTLHVYFLAQPPRAPDLAPLYAGVTDEEFVLGADAFYLHVPSGLGRSIVAERVERTLGVTTTARNWRTVLALHALAHG